MNITNLEYNQTPFSKIKKYEIHTLTEDGTKNYLKKESYVHRFLRSLDHERIKDIFDYQYHGVTEDKDRANSNSEEEKSYLKTVHKDDENNMDHNIKIESVNEQKKFKSIQQSQHLTLNKQSQFGILKGSKLFKKSETGNFFHSQKITKPSLKQKRDFPISLRRSSIIKSKNLQPHSDENDVNGSKYKEDHVQQLNNLKESLRGIDADDNSKKTPKLFSSHKKRNNSLGFTFNQIPNVHHDINSKNSNLSPRSPNPKFQIFKNRLLKTFNIDKQLDNTNELERFEKILEHNDYLETHHMLPKISVIFNQEKIKNVEIKLKSNKIMGEKYNPLNFYHNQSKSTTRRNIYGSLFQH